MCEPARQIQKFIWSSDRSHRQHGFPWPQSAVWGSHEEHRAGSEGVISGGRLLLTVWMCFNSAQVVFCSVFDLFPLVEFWRNQAAFLACSPFLLKEIFLFCFVLPRGKEIPSKGAKWGSNPSVKSLRREQCEPLLQGLLCLAGAGAMSSACARGTWWELPQPLRGLHLWEGRGTFGFLTASTA